MQSNPIGLEEYSLWLEHPAEEGEGSRKWQKTTQIEEEEIALSPQSMIRNDKTGDLKIGSQLKKLYPDSNLC